MHEVMAQPRAAREAGQGAGVATVETLHDRKLRLMRAQLAELALTSLLERGFDAVTIDELAAAAGISRRSFFRYFATKEEVVTCAFDATGDALLAEFGRRPRSEPPLRALRSSLQIVIDAFERDPARTRATLRLIRRTPALRGQFLLQQEDWAEQLAAAMRARLPKGVRAPLLAQLTARVGVAAIDAAMTAWIEHEDQELGALADEAFDALSVRAPGAAGRGQG